MVEIHERLDKSRAWHATYVAYRKLVILFPFPVKVFSVQMSSSAEN